MKVLAKDIRRFHKLYLQYVGISLSDDEARRKLNRLLRQVEVLVDEESKKLRLRQDEQRRQPPDKI